MKHSSVGCLIAHSHLAAVAKRPEMFGNNNDESPRSAAGVSAPQVCL